MGLGKVPRTPVPISLPPARSSAVGYFLSSSSPERFYGRCRQCAQRIAGHRQSGVSDPALPHEKDVKNAAGALEPEAAANGLRQILRSWSAPGGQVLSGT